MGLFAVFEMNHSRLEHLDLDSKQGKECLKSNESDKFIGLDVNSLLEIALSKLSTFNLQPKFAVDESRFSSYFNGIVCAKLLVPI